MEENSFSVVIQYDSDLEQLAIVGGSDVHDRPVLQGPQPQRVPDGMQHVLATYAVSEGRRQDPHVSHGGIARGIAQTAIHSFREAA